jgi:hypothetical protein
MKALRLLVASVALCASLNVQPANRCVDLFSAVASRVEASSQYQKDFGAGVFVRKVSNQEFRIEPPPEVATSIRQAQLAVGKRSQGGDSSITVLFDGFSEGEVLGFKAMLARDTKIKEDETLTAILLGGESPPGHGYDSVRNVALAARDRMNRRYQWADAKVDAKPSAPGEREERYLLTAQREDKPDEFLLKVRLRAASMMKNRVAQITAALAKPSLVDATSEQVAHEMIATLKKADPGVTAVTLKVIAGDFVIADNARARKALSVGGRT